MLTLLGARVAPVSSPTASAPGDGVCDTAITVHAPEATPMYWYQDSLTYEPYVRTCRLECPDKARNCTSPSSYGDIYPNPTPFSIVEDLGAPATTTLNVPNPTHYSALTVDNNPQFSTYEVTTTFALPQQTGKDGTPFSDTMYAPIRLNSYQVPN